MMVRVARGRNVAGGGRSGGLLPPAFRHTNASAGMEYSTDWSGVCLQTMPGTGSVFEITTHGIALRQGLLAAKAALVHEPVLAQQAFYQPGQPCRGGAIAPASTWGSRLGLTLLIGQETAYRHRSA